MTTWRTGDFTASLWEDAAEILTRIHQLDFLTELAEGTLSPEIFVEYIQQDSFYLVDYAKALAMLSARAPHPRAGQFWAGAASGAVAAEQELHAELIGDQRLADLPRPETLSATTRGYMHTLTTACAYDPYEVGAAAVLPCFWIYAEVGIRLAARARQVADHPFGRWMAEYGDPEFIEAAQQAIDLVDEAASGASGQVREQMREAFLDASRYEELFWSAAYAREVWTR